MNFQLTTTVISKTEDRPYGLQNLSQNNQEFRLMSRVCQLCLPQLWSDELSPVNSGREGCMGRVWSGREAGMSQAQWTVSMKAGGRRSRYRRSKCLPLGPGERTQRAAPTHTHTHTHTHTCAPWALLAQRELHLLFWAFLHWILEPWLMASCQLPAS